MISDLARAVGMPPARDRVAIPEDRLEGFPKVDELLEKPVAFEQFMTVMEWCFDELERAAKSGGAESTGLRS